VHDESDTGLEDRPGIGRDLGRDLADLYHAGYRRLVAQVFAFTTDLNEAQDAVQEAFARALARPRGLAGVDAPEAWLRTVAINVVRRRWRRKQILNTLLLRERPLVRAFEEPPEPERADLREALATLPRAYREVIVLHYLADLPVDEVAAILEVPAMCWAPMRGLMMRLRAMSRCQPVGLAWRWLWSASIIGSPRSSIGTETGRVPCLSPTTATSRSSVSSLPVPRRFASRGLPAARPRA